MTRAEFVEWRAFYELEPWGSGLEDLRFAMLAFMQAGGGEGRKITDFLPRRLLPLLAEAEEGRKPAPKAAAAAIRAALLSLLTPAQVHAAQAAAAAKKAR